jgi:hypothetical protein
MDLSPVKREILEAVLMHDKPVKAAQVAREVGKDFPPVMMHLLGLARMGYACSPEKGQFILTDSGKKALGLPEITKENAAAIMQHVPRESAFHFYAGIGKPLNLYAHSLQDFCDKIAKVNVESVEFHVSRGDFESWFACLGDAELAKKTALLKERKLAGEELCRRLLEIVENRCIVLSKMVGHSVPSA